MLGWETEDWVGWVLGMVQGMGNVLGMGMVQERFAVSKGKEPLGLPH